MHTTRISVSFFIFLFFCGFSFEAFGKGNFTQIPEGIMMVSIPAGSFTMGNNNAKGPLAGAHMPERTVTIGAFQMSEAEITNEQYTTFLNAAMADGLIKIGTGISMGQPAVFVVGNDGQDYAEQRFMELSGSRVLKDHDGDGTIDPENPLNQCWIEYDEATNQFSVKDPQAIDWDNYPYESGETRANWDQLAAGNLPTLDEVKRWPVSFIKWYGAYIFAQYYGLDLPTEAEWEYASEGGREFQYGTVDGTLDATKANYNENNVHPDLGHVVEVKSYPPNPFGLYDLAGNVWEWCLDWYDEGYYAENETEDPVNDTPIIGEPILDDPTCGGAPGQPYTCDTRVKRGGSWNFHAATLESSSRERDLHWRGNDHFGFRVVLRGEDTPRLEGEFVLALPQGVSLIHLPLAVTSVNDQPASITTVGEFYDAIGSDNVNFIITYDSSAETWRSYLGDLSRGSSADAGITNEMGFIMAMKNAVTLQLKGDALGEDGTSQINLSAGTNLVGLPLMDARLQNVSDLLKVEGIQGSVAEVIVYDDETFKAVAQAGDGGDIPLTGGQSFIIIASTAGSAEITGDAWDNVSAGFFYRLQHTIFRQGER